MWKDLAGEQRYFRLFARTWTGVRRQGRMAHYSHPWRAYRAKHHRARHTEIRPMQHRLFGNPRRVLAQISTAR